LSARDSARNTERDLKNAVKHIPPKLQKFD
jgi:hypothetical protein